jgi:hypothetical protein|tara:strand:- start:1775 stop:3097 length:1323 start_codon:yes stop_codon:yes gene_type:complete
MKKIIFPFLIALSALLVSGSAAFYSVFGLSKLFAGASNQVIIMAGSLEFAKLVAASLLYQYWGTINKVLRTYLSIAVLVLMVITSGGIYGFLSGAYQETATKSEFLDKSLSVLEIKQTRFEENKTDLKIEKEQLNKSISELRISLSNPASVSYWDENSQTVITTTSSSSRRALQKELENTIVDRNDLNIKLEVVQDSIMSLDSRILDLEISNEDERELGPLKYLAETTGQDMGQVVNWFLLLIVFVFDPLAIAMVIAANFAFAQIRKPEEKTINERVDNNDFNGEGETELRPFTYKPKVKIEKKDLIMDDMEEVGKYPTTEDIIKFNREESIDEKRMNIIGQNGNDGLHYDERYLEELNQSIHKELWEEDKWLEDTHPSIHKRISEEEILGLGKESIENEEKKIIVIEEEVKPMSAKEAMKLKQQNKLQSENILIYRNNR